MQINNINALSVFHAYLQRDDFSSAARCGSGEMQNAEIRRPAEDCFRQSTTNTNDLPSCHDGCLLIITARLRLSLSILPQTRLIGGRRRWPRGWAYQHDAAVTIWRVLIAAWRNINSSSRSCAIPGSFKIWKTTVSTRTSSRKNCVHYESPLSGFNCFTSVFIAIRAIYS